MSFKKLVNNKKLVLLFFFILVVLLKFDTINTPYIRDSFGNYVSPSIWVKDHSFNPFFGDEMLGNHPPLFFEALALSFSIFGTSLWVGHLFILVSAVVILFFTYLIGSHLYNPRTGIIASLLLLFSPLFFAQIGMVMLDVFLTMMVTITLYFAITKKDKHYLIAGSLLALTKAPGIIIIILVTLYKLIIEKEKTKKVIIYASPVLLFLAWLILSRIAYGWFFSSYFVSLMRGKYFLIELYLRINQVFITNYHVILTLLIIIFLAKSDRFFKKGNIMFLSLIASATGYVTCRYIANILGLIKSATTIDLAQVFRFNFHDLYILRYVSPFLVFSGFLILESIKSKSLMKSLKKESILFLLCIFSVIIFFSCMSFGYMQRYMLMIYPLFFILGSRALTRIFKKDLLVLIATICLLILFLTKWWAPLNTECGTCEENMQYLSLISLHKDMAEFIESRYPDKTVLTEFPQSKELKDPSGGYVTKSINSIKLEKDEFFITGTNNYTIPSLDEFDLIYYSVGGLDSKELGEIVRLYNLILIKKIENDGKIAFLYGKNITKGDSSFRH